MALKSVNSSLKSVNSKHKSGGDIQKFLSGSKFTTTGIPGDLHLPEYSFCGLGTNLDKWLDEDNNPKPWSKPKNRVDEVCMKHNIDYGNSTTLEEKQEVDLEMLYYLSLKQIQPWEKKLIGSSWRRWSVLNWNLGLEIQKTYRL